MHRALSAGAIILLLLVCSRAAGQFQAVSERWQARYSGPGNYHDELSDMTVDAAGNVYITGYNYGKDTDRDYVTVKYDGQGQQLWSRRYNGPGNNRDMAEAITVDQEGNVYVAGYSYGSGANYDFTTIKYDRDGNELWVARYNGPGNSHEYATAAAVDDQSNVYVTGYHQLSGAQTDCITIKYDAAGAEQWVRRYNGPADGYDNGRVLKVDGGGNVIVSGYSEGVLTSRDYLTIKYDPNGIELWTARQTGPSQGYDEASALVVDAEDNVYVTGRSYGSSGGTDFLTIKYNASGIEQWAQRYSGPAWTGGDQGKALALDDWGNIYVSGISKSSTSGYDYVTIKYRTDNGNLEWVKRYEAQADWDSPVELALDETGNVYISGEGYVSGPEVDYITIKYDTDGKAQWLSWYDGPASGADRAGAIGIDELGYIYVSGVSMAEITQQDITTIKYDPDGEQQWTTRYNGAGISDDEIQALEIDQEGAVYVAGCVRSGLNYDYATVKYDSRGNEQWVRLYGQEQWNEQAQALGIDSEGSVCVTGNRGSHCVTVKYDGAGNELWAIEHHDALSSSDYAYSLAIDSEDNILIGGYSYQADAGGNNYRVIKYDPNGYEMWSAGYNGPANSSDRAYTIKTDHLDNVLITGYSYSSDTSYDYATVKFDPDGNQLWVARYNGTDNSSDYARALTVDGAGNAYVTGYVFNSGAGRDYATIKYDPNGIELWAICYDGPAHGSDYAQAITVDEEGNVYVTGYSYGYGTGYDFATIKYNRHGVELWVVRHNDPINNGDYAQAIAQDGENGIYVSGYSYVDGAADYVTIKYTSDANQVWTARYDGPADGIDDIPKVLALDRRGNTYVSGVSGGVATDQDFLTIKYSQLGMMAADQPRPIEIRNLKVKAAKRNPLQQGPWEDSFDLLGAFDIQPEQINAADYIYVTLWNAHEIIFRGLLPFEPEKFKKGKYTVKGPPGGMTWFMFNLNKTKPIFRIKARKVNLTGLNSPVILELEIGDYYGIGLAGEGAQDYMLMGLTPEHFKDNINGRNPLPMKLMLGYADALRVDKARLKHNNKTGYDSLYVRGALAVWDRAVDLTNEQVTIRWGENDFTETIDKGNFKNINGKYIYRKPKSTDEQNDDKKIVLAIFDLQKCVFVISVKKAQIESQTQTIPFEIEFGGFDRVAYYTLDDKN